MATNALQQFFGNRFRRIITSSPDGVPGWLAEVEAGDDLGLFSPTDAPWVVHRNITTLIGGIRALLVQALHPGSLAGVAEHSRYEQDPLGRLAGTTRWLTIMTFGSMQSIREEAKRVNGMHRNVSGSYIDEHGKSKNYRAQDTDLLAWVHIAFTDSFLTTFELYSGLEIPGGADAYISEWGKAVAPLGLNDVPTSRAELQRDIKSYLDNGILRVDERTREVVRFIQNPPLSRAALIVYGLLFDAAVASLEPEFLDLLGLKPKPLSKVQPRTQRLMSLFQLAIGQDSPIEEAALKRRARLSAN